jgi:hypothetical protein
MPRATGSARTSLVDRLGHGPWLAASGAEREAGLREAAALLYGFGAVDVAIFAGFPVARLRHERTGVLFHLVPGGVYRRGLSPAERKAVKKAASPAERPLLDGALADLAPAATTADVAPFLLAARPFTLAELAALGWTGGAELDCVETARASDLPALLTAASFRLPTDTEWERAARGGTLHAFPSGDGIPPGPRAEANGFGLERLGELPELCAEGTGFTVRGGALLSAPWQGALEWTAMLCAARRPLDGHPRISVRPARDLFTADVAQARAAVAARKRAKPLERVLARPAVAPAALPGALADLAAIDWDAVEVVPGSGRASRIPETLATLDRVDSSPEERQQAIGMLHARLAGDGTLREVSAIVAPHLVRLAARPELPDRHQLLALLGVVAVGDPRSRCASGVAVKERTWARPPGATVLRAIADGRSMLLAALGDGRPEVRRTAAYVLGFLPPVADAAIPELLRVARDDTDPTVRVTALHAAALLGPPAAEHALYESAIAREEDRARDGAICALLVVRAEHASDAELDLATRISRAPGDGSLGDAPYPFVPMPGGWLAMIQGVLAPSGERGQARWRALLAEMKAESDRLLGRA